MTYGYVSTNSTNVACPVSCSFTYHSVIPPSHCPYCGRCLGCGTAAPPPYPYPQPWPRPAGPVWYTQPYADNPFPNVVIS